jgi:hypothetical protein
MLFGSQDARTKLAHELADADDRSVFKTLVATVASAEPWTVRARSLELLGLIAGTASQGLAEEILGALARASW